MNQIVTIQAHAPVGYMGMLGCDGYQNATNIICMTASGDNHFIAEGIVEGSLLFMLLPKFFLFSGVLQTECASALQLPAVP